MSYIKTVDTCETAWDVVRKMRQLLKEYDAVSIADLKDIVGRLDEIDRGDGLQGWMNLDDVDIVPGQNDCADIILPDPIQFDQEKHEDSDTDIDLVNHPPHYQSKAGLEVINVIEAFTTDLCGIEATDTGNIIKYICRWKSKNGLQDLQKAKWYLEHLIAHVEKGKEFNNEG